ncbi:hypothetical protein V5799_000942 [Amblyomma americanum]|uniref:Uncharacterized protein n=1 Tax=Amblyomma americanum TaxID=6943 RepID=A0AAQ4D1L8_AMBAM
MAEMQQELSAVLRERSLLSGVLDKVEAVTRIKREVLVYGEWATSRAPHAARAHRSLVVLAQLLVLVVCALPHPQCPARLIYARYLRHRVWYETGAVSSISAMASSAVEHISSAVSKATNGGQESPARKKPAAHKEAPPPPPKKSAAVGKKGTLRCYA